MKIVTTIDFSLTSESILKNTAIYAKTFDAEVFLIHACLLYTSDAADE